MFMQIAAVLLGFTLTVSTLVLRSGDRIPVDGEVREQAGVVTFRSGGALYSIRLAEVDLEATTGFTAEVRQRKPEEPVLRFQADPETRKRLIAELEKNRAGTPAQPQAVLEQRPEPPAPGEVREQLREENQWRRQARAYEEAILRAQEDLALIESEIESLQSEIQTLFALGYKPKHFTHETTRLERLRERIPQARLAVQRAERAWDTFREDARRQGILPGWLR